MSVGWAASFNLETLFIYLLSILDFPHNKNGFKEVVYYIQRNVIFSYSIVPIFFIRIVIKLQSITLLPILQYVYINNNNQLFIQMHPFILP